MPGKYNYLHYFYQPGYRFPVFLGGGKSGQQKATHRLSAGSDYFGKIVPQKITVIPMV